MAWLGALTSSNREALRAPASEEVELQEIMVFRMVHVFQSLSVEQQEQVSFLFDIARQSTEGVGKDSEGVRDKLLNESYREGFTLSLQTMAKEMHEVFASAAEELVGLATTEGT